MIWTVFEQKLKMAKIVVLCPPYTPHVCSLELKIYMQGLVTLRYSLLKSDRKKINFCGFYESLEIAILGF